MNEATLNFFTVKLLTLNLALFGNFNSSIIILDMAPIINKWELVFYDSYVFALYFQ